MATQSFQLVMSAGPTPDKAFPLSKQEIIIGRDTNADISINIAEVSRRHARMRFEPNGFSIEDVGSTNGTFVNGQRLTSPQVLRPGDRIQLGEAVTMIYQVSQYDMNATVVPPSSSKETITPAQGMPPVSAPPQARPAPPPAPARPPAPPPGQPVYSGQVPSGPPAQMAPPVPEKEGRPWLWAGLGCVGVVLCLVAVGAIAFDMMNLYCTPPFNSLFSFVYTCP